MSKAGGEQGPKVRERVDAVEQRMTVLEDGLARRMAALDAWIAQQDAEIQRLRAKNEGLEMQIKDLSAQIDRQLREAGEAIDEIRSAGGLHLSRAAVLDVEDLAELLEQEPDRRLICVSGSAELGLQPGEAFDPRAKFANPTQARQFAVGGTAFAAAPV